MMPFIFALMSWTLVAGMGGFVFGRMVPGGTCAVKMVIALAGATILGTSAISQNWALLTIALTALVSLVLFMRLGEILQAQNPARARARSG